MTDDELIAAVQLSPVAARVDDTMLAAVVMTAATGRTMDVARVLRESHDGVTEAARKEMAEASEPTRERVTQEVHELGVAYREMTARRAAAAARMVGLDAGSLDPDTIALLAASQPGWVDG